MLTSTILTSTILTDIDQSRSLWLVWPARHSYVSLCGAQQGSASRRPRMAPSVPRPLDLTPCNQARPGHAPPKAPRALAGPARRAGTHYHHCISDPILTVGPAGRAGIRRIGPSGRPSGAGTHAWACRPLLRGSERRNKPPSAGRGRVCMSRLCIVCIVCTSVDRVHLLTDAGPSGPPSPPHASAHMPSRSGAGSRASIRPRDGRAERLSAREPAGMLLAVAAGPIRGAPECAVLAETCRSAGRVLAETCRWLQGTRKGRHRQRSWCADVAAAARLGRRGHHREHGGHAEGRRPLVSQHLCPPRPPAP